MAPHASTSSDSPLRDLRRRGQFLIGVLLWAAAGGLLVVVCSGALVTYHYAISLAERVRLGLGFAPPRQGPDWFLLIALSAGPLIALLALVAFANWYRRLWLRRVALVWPDTRQRRQLSIWRLPPGHRNESGRQERSAYITSLLESPGWSDRSCPRPREDCEGRSAWVLEELEKDIAERALATGLTVGIRPKPICRLFHRFCGGSGIATPCSVAARETAVRSRVANADSALWGQSLYQQLSEPSGFAGAQFDDQEGRHGTQGHGRPDGERITASVRERF